MKSVNIINRIEFVKKGPSKGAIDLPKPIRHYAGKGWGNTDKLNPGTYNVPSGSNAEKKNTYRVVAGKAKAETNGKRVQANNANAGTPVTQEQFASLMLLVSKLAKKL